MEIIGYNKPFNRNAIEPTEFLRWAKQDFRGGDQRSIGNTVGNIKKAIHSRIDEIISQTRVQYSHDWNPMAGTDIKLQALKLLGIQYRSIITPLTKIRNRYEHEYLLPTKEEAELFLDIADLWMEKSYNQYHIFPVAMSKIPTGNFGVYSNRTEERITMLSFEAKSSAVFFNDSKKVLVNLDRTGTETKRKFNSLTWREILKEEAKAIKPVLEVVANNPVRGRLLTEKNINFLYNQYKKYLNGTFVEITK